MSLVPFLVVAGLGAVALVLVRGSARTVAIGGGVGMIGALVAAVFIVPGQAVVVEQSGFATTEYLRLFLILGVVVGSCLVIVGAAGGTQREAPAVTLGILATSALALALPDARLAFVAATAGGAFAVVAAAGMGGGRRSATAGIRVLRASVIAGTMAIAASAWIGRDLSELAAQPTVFGLAYLAVAVAVALRLGAIPFHNWAARLTDAVAEPSLPLVTAWAAGAFAIAALAWTDASIAPLLVDLAAIRIVILSIAIASITLASIATWIQDDIEHVVGYSIVGDAGVIMLAVAALDPDAWAPARTWILAFVVSRSAFAAWAAATRLSFGTGRISELRGWAVRSPLLGVAFAAVVLASIGLPGLAAFDARARLIDLALGGPLGAVVFIAALTPLAYYGRLAAVGLTRAGSTPGDGPWRPVVASIDLTHVWSWAATTWSTNRAFIASATAALLAVLAVATMAGAFGVREAAAGLAPTVEGAIESFTPIASGSPEPVPSPSVAASPSAEASPSLEASPSDQVSPSP